MNKEEFFIELNKGLEDRGLSLDEEMFQYYTEMIEDRVASGMSEEEAVASLEDIDSIIENISKNNGGIYKTLIEDSIDLSKNVFDLATSIVAGVAKEATNILGEAAKEVGKYVNFERLPADNKTITFTNAEINKINVTTVSCNITLERDDDSDGTITYDANYYEVIKNGTAITVKGKTLIQSDSEELVITVPSTYVLDYNFKTVSGEVELSEVSTKALTIASVSGEINVEECKIYSLNAKSTSGRITVDDSAIGYITTDSISGAVDLDNIKCKDVKANTVSGNIDVSIYGTESMFTTTIVEGNKTIKTTTLFGGNISLKTISGKTDVTYLG